MCNSNIKELENKALRNYYQGTMTITEFLTKHKISPESFELDDVCKYFLSEMKNGLEKKPSSLPMINSFCSTDFTAEPGKPIIVIDAGGTNFRTCLVNFDNDLNPVVTDFQKRKMPGIEKEVSSKEFFSIIADETQRLLDKSDRIGFCFSYAAEILADHDGIPLMFSKEIKAPEVLGKHLGKELFAEFSRRGFDVSKKKIIILNDTVTTLLAGLAKTSALGCEGCVGFILGTGTNTAYIHDNTIINIESGCLKFSLGDLDEKHFSETKEPEKYNFEKMISGAYLGSVIRVVFEQAAKEGFFSPSFSVPENFVTADADNMHFDNKQDDENAKIIAATVIKRAAKLTAANLAASILATDFGKDKPVLINADGTTFYLTPGLRENTEKYLEEYLAKFGRKAVFTKIEQSPVIGSAIGALSLK